MTDPNHNPTPPDGDRPEPDDASFTRESDQIDVGDVHAPIMRELAEPRDGYEPVPIWLIFVFFALIGWGGAYLMYFSGGFKSNVYNEHPEARLRAASAQPTPVDPLVLGKRTYVTCRTCHQDDGRGVAGSYPPLDGSERVAGPPESLVRIVLGGLEGEVTVKGQPYDNIMPGWRDQLSDEKIAAVLTYVRQAWGNDAAPVEAALVERMRPSTAARGRAWTDPALDAALDVVLEVTPEITSLETGNEAP